jgi:hypothetical protein
VRNAEGNTPLHWACLNGRADVVRVLLTRGAAAAVLNAAGRSPVDEALAGGHEALLAVISECDAASGGGGADAIEEDGGGEGEDVEVEEFVLGGQEDEGGSGGGSDGDAAGAAAGAASAQGLADDAKDKLTL